MSARIVSTPRVMGGFPCFEGTRIPYDTILQLVDHETIFPEDIPRMYPRLTPEAWQTARDYEESSRA